MWDVIVVGTGPAGALAAYELAQNGCRTLLLEKEKLPRYKTCGGGIVQRSSSALPFAVSCIQEREISAIQLTNNFKHLMFIQKEEPLVLMTMRSAFDQYLTNKALEAGAEIREGVQVKDVTENASGVDCLTDSGNFQSSFLVAADGVNSVVAKSLKWSRPVCGVALEVEVSLRSEYRYADQIDFDFHVLPHGYGWVFPKKKHLSCGVFTMERSCPEIRKHYDRYVSRKSFSGEICDANLHGHLIPLKPVSNRLHSRRCVLTGDAAGLADPLSGEGISFAIRSGRMAAAAILDQRLDRYSEEVAHTLAREIKLARVLARILYSTPSFLYGMLARKDFFADRILDLFAGKTTYAELAKSVLLKPYKLL